MWAVAAVCRLLRPEPGAAFPLERVCGSRRNIRPAAAALLASPPAPQVEGSIPFVAGEWVRIYVNDGRLEEGE